MAEAVGMNPASQKRRSRPRFLGPLDLRATAEKFLQEANIRCRDQQQAPAVLCIHATRVDPPMAELEVKIIVRPSRRQTESSWALQTLPALGDFPYEREANGSGSAPRSSKATLGQIIP